MHPNLTEEMKINHFCTPQRFGTQNDQKHQTNPNFFGRHPECLSPKVCQTQNTDSIDLRLTRKIRNFGFLEELQAFRENAYQKVENLLYAKMSPNLKKSILSNIP